MDSDLDSALLQLERRGWDALCGRHGKAFYRALLAPDGLMVFPGLRLDREAALEAIPDGPSWSGYELYDEAVHHPSVGTAVVVYRGVARRDEARYEAEMTSTYVLRDGRWCLALHQQSPIAPAATS